MGKEGFGNQDSGSSQNDHRERRMTQMKKNRRFPYNGPTLHMQTQFLNGKISWKTFSEHCDEQRRKHSPRILTPDS